MTTDHRPPVLSSAPYKQIRDLPVDVAVLPWGATEPHNLHLPYGTDIIECDRIGQEAARKAVLKGGRVIVLPTVPFGVNTGQIDFPLTINMNPSTQMAVLEDVVDSLERQGIPKLAILNGHGGNDFRQMIREIQIRHRIFLCSMNWWTCIDTKPFFENAGDHAGELETSLMMHLAPELVLPLSEAGIGREKSMRIRAFRQGWAWAPRQWRKVTEDTGTGNPKPASADKGRRYFEAATDTIADFLVELGWANLEDLYE
jgi:creatinine amidohydrolase